MSLFNFETKFIFIYSFIQNILMLYYVQGTVLGSRDIIVNKICELSDRRLWPWWETSVMMGKRK